MGAVDGTLVGVGAEVSWEVNLAPFFAPRPPLAHWCGLAAVTPAEALVLANRLRALNVGIEALLTDIAAAPPLLPGRLENSNRASSVRSEEHTSELQSLMRISYAVFCLKKKTRRNIRRQHIIN